MIVNDENERPQKFVVGKLDSIHLENGFNKKSSLVYSTMISLHFSPTMMPYFPCLTFSFLFLHSQSLALSLTRLHKYNNNTTANWYNKNTHRLMNFDSCFRFNGLKFFFSFQPLLEQQQQQKHYKVFSFTLNIFLLSLKKGKKKPYWHLYIYHICFRMCICAHMGK